MINRISFATIVLIGGELLGETVVQYGTFVMNTEKEIRHANQDFHNERRRFEKSPTWRSSPNMLHLKSLFSTCLLALERQG